MPQTCRLKALFSQTQMLEAGPVKAELRSCPPTLWIGKGLHFGVRSTSKLKLNVHHWKTNCFPKKTRFCLCFCFSIFPKMLQDMCLLQLPYKIQLRKLQASYSLNKLEIPPNGQICYSMNGIMDILRIFFFFGWVRDLICVLMGLFIKKSYFQLWKAICSQVNILSVGIFVAVLGLITCSGGRGLNDFIEIKSQSQI